MTRSVRTLFSGLVAACLFTTNAGAEYDPEIVVVKAGTIITASGDAIEGGEIIIEDGEITLVGLSLDSPKNAEVIDARDMTVMPGMILARTRLNLPFIRRSGVNGQFVARDEVYPDLTGFRPALESGYTAVAFVPPGTGITGRASVYRVMEIDGLRTLDADNYLRATFEDAARDKGAMVQALTKAQAEIDKIEEAREEWEKQKEAWDKKQAEAKKAAEKESENGGGDTPADEGDAPKGDEPKPEGARRRATEEPSGGETGDDSDPTNGGEKKDEGPGEFVPPEIDPSVKPLVDLILGEAEHPLIIEIGGASEMLHLRDAFEQVTIDAEPKHVLAMLSPSGDYSYQIESLASVAAGHEGDDGPLLMVSPAMYTERYTVERVNLLGELAFAGFDLVSVPSSLRGSSSQLEDVRQELGMLVREGLDHDEAIRSLTLHPARLLGIDTDFGSIEKGKTADLVFFNGDPLDPASSVQKVMIEGRIEWETE
ncbi:MAG: amidohydrolase family protein [Planctomycetota bacterium]